MSQIMKFSREYQKEDTVIEVGDVKIGGKYFAIAAGPCAIESQEQYYETAKSVKAAGANIIRGSVFKPRTSPYSFQGLGRDGLKLIKDLGEDLNIVTVTEVMDPRDVKITSENVDILQIGARNMQNFDLLKEASTVNNPIILKRGLSATINEWLHSAEYLMAKGNHKVILCERGIRTFVNSTRNTLDLSVIPILKMKTHLPIIIDPSHATGNRNLIIPVSKAAVVSNADGLIIEVHCDPDSALCDGAQSLTLGLFEDLIHQIKHLIEGELKFVTGSSIDLDEVRRRINVIDRDIIDLISRRFSLVPNIVEFKQKRNLPIFQPDREQELHKKYIDLATKYKINPDFIVNVFNQIINESRKLQAERIKSGTK